jgi:serralysin
VPPLSQGWGRLLDDVAHLACRQLNIEWRLRDRFIANPPVAHWANVPDFSFTAVQSLVASNIQFAYSADHTQVELAIPLASIGTPSNPIDVPYDVNGTTFGPTSYANQPYVAPNADVARTPTHRVAIVYSDTTAANYYRGLGDAAGAPSTAYDDLFMAAQNQARMAGVSYDIIDESQLTDVNNLIGYDALIFPAMTDVNTAQLPAIMSALTGAVYD